MKKILNLFFMLAITVLIFSACDKNDDPIPDPVESDANGLYFFNYGGDAGATITRYNPETNVAINGYYEAQNQTMIGGPVQYALDFNNKIYLLGNYPDQVIVLDSMFIQSASGITEKINSPRFCVGTGHYLYISCLGASPDWNVMPDSYIAKFNINTNTVEKTYPMPGGPEGLIIANNKLYAALNYRDSIGVIDLNNEATSYIATPAVSSYFIMDRSENLYVSLVSTSMDPSTKTGLGYVNTTTNSLDTIYNLEGISGGYSAIMAPNFSHSIIYVLASSWGAPGNIYKFNTETKEYSVFIENISGVNGMFVDPTSAEGKVYVFGAESYSEPGTVKVYSVVGNYESEFDCGISPYWAMWLDYEE